MTTARRKSNPVAPGVEAARPEASDNRPGESHRPPPNANAPQRVPVPYNNLSLPRSPLIGRGHEVATIQQLLFQEQVGLLTLTGPGGIGKTRLALQVAANLLDHFVDGVYFVSLAPISDPDLVGATIAQTLGVREAPGRSMQESLQEYLCDKQLLLVLDNFEQILPATPLVGALLSDCRRLKVVVTSRATLHLYGEQEFPVPPLALPILDFGFGILDSHISAADQSKIQNQKLKIDAASLSEYADIDLFCQRARAAKPDFALTPSNAADVAKLCIGLDGLPLAIELAAARIKLFSLSALLARLNQRLTLLTDGPHDLPTRQRTLRDEIAWSYDLLTPDEQTLFRRLAVFIGGFTLEAAQAVGDISADRGVAVLNGVASLVDKNLLRQVEGLAGEARFAMLETIREYGLAQLKASREAEVIHHQHANFFLALAETTEPELLGAQRRQGLARLEVELDNLRAALVWSQMPSRQDDQGQAALGLRLAAALTWFAHFGNHFNEGRSWLVASLQRTTEPTVSRAKALWGAGLIALIQGDFADARSKLLESEVLWRKSDDSLGLAITLRELCLLENAQHQPVAAQRYGEESIALCRTMGSQWDLALALDNLGLVLANQGDQKNARLLLQESVALFRVVDDTWGLSGAIISLGFVASQQGDYLTAYPLLEESLTLRRALKDKWMITNSLNLLGEVRQRQGQLEQARNFYCECLAIAYEIGDKACIAHILHHLGTLAQSQTEHERAVRLFAVAATMRGMAAGLVFHTLVAPTDQPAGLAGVKEALAGFYTAFSDIQIEIEQIMIDGDYVTVRQVARGTHDHDFLGIPATGKPVVITSHDIYRVEDGMMVEVWHVEDLLNTLLQIGAFPPAGK